jgi:transcriptional regulator with GAF, ATPase, and Fis domain
MSVDVDTLRLSRRRISSAPVAVAHLFVVMQCDQPLAAAARINLADADEVLIVRGEQGVWREPNGGRRLVLSIPDPYMSREQTRLCRSGGPDFVLYDGGSSNGTWVNGTRRTELLLKDGDSIQTGSTFLSFRQFSSCHSDLKLDPCDTQRGGLRTLLPELEHCFSMLRQVARSGVPVVVLGESGTGKELAARDVHRHSGRDGAFVALNCGALPSTLLEAELFGYRKGAFSGATEDRLGLVRASHGGTLMLDEIGDLPASAQTALLRVLQEREVLPLGCTRPVPVDLRLVCATHRDLDALAASGSFRPDLLARISGYTLELPSLRERREDTGLLIAELMTRRAGSRAAAMRISPEAGRQLICADWPLNVRELEQCLAVALAFADDRISLEHLGRKVLSSPPAAVERSSVGPRTLSLKERDDCLELVSVLRRHGGNISAAARELGKERIQIRRLIKRFGVDLQDLS